MKPYIIDHFYIVLPDTIFLSTKQELEAKYGAVHKTITSGSQKWEGLYIYSDEGTYFEILKDNNSNFKSGQLGIALSSRIPNSDLGNHLASIQNDLDIYDQLDETNKTWFTAYSLKHLPGLPMSYVWYMEYKNNYFSARFNRRDTVVKRFTRLTFETSEEVLIELNNFTKLPDFQPSLKFELATGHSLEIIIKPSKEKINFKIDVE